MAVGVGLAVGVAVGVPGGGVLGGGVLEAGDVRLALGDGGRVVAGESSSATNPVTEHAARSAAQHAASPGRMARP